MQKLADVPALASDACATDDGVARGDIAGLRAFLDRGQADGAILDLDGTLRSGGHWLPGARELLEDLAARALPFVILTNDASAFAPEKGEDLRAAGAAIRDEQILTCADLALATLVRRGWMRAGLVGRLGRSLPADHHLLPWGSGAAPDTDVVILGSGTRLDEELLSAWAAARPRHCLVANADLAWLPAPGTLSPCPGLVARALRALSESLGHAVEFIECGKPSPSAFDAAVARLRAIAGAALPHRRIVVFGDSNHSDIAPARRCDLQVVQATTGLHRWERVPAEA